MPSEAAECIDCGELIPILGPCPHCDAAPDRRVDPVTWAATKPPEAVKVTQEDRDAAALLARDLGTLTRMEQAGTINGGADSGCYVQAFARHREEAEKRVRGNPVLQLVAGYADYTAISDDRWEQGKAAGYRELGEIVAASMPDHHSGEQ